MGRPPWPWIGNRLGFTTVEWAVAAVLLLTLFGLCAALVTTFTRWAFHQSRGAEWHQQAALASTVLGSDLRRVGAAGDWHPHAGDSVTMRTYRGTAWICARTGGASPRAHVVYKGDRSPNPAKDSVAAVDGEGVVRVLALRSRRSRGACPGVAPARGWRIEEWDLGGSVPREALLRLFESGTYSVSGGALRYRVGRGGRQPVVGSSFDTTSGLSGHNVVGGRPSIILSVVSSVAPYRPTAQTLSVRLYPRRTLP